MRIFTTVLSFVFTLVFALPAFAVNDGMQCYKLRDKGLSHLKSEVESYGIQDLTDCKAFRVKAKLYCSPAENIVTSVGGATPENIVGGEVPNNLTCYKVRCKDAIELSGGLYDTNGERNAEKFKLQMLCFPEGAELLQPTTTSTTTTTTTIPN